MAAARTSLYSTPVIDLTQSDEEQDGSSTHIRILRRRPSQPLTTHPPQEFPVSNHGLVLRDSFNFPLSNHGDIRQLQGASNAASRRSTERPFSKVATRAQNGSVPIANTAKRRKTHGGMMAIAPGHNLSVEDHRHTQPTRSKRLDSRATTAIGSHHHARIAELVLPRQTLDRSRVSSQLHIPSHKHRTQPTGQDTDYKTDERMIYVLENQVFRHITSALRKFRKTLSRAERNRIGTKTARKLINKPGFFKDFEAHEWMLSKDYEARLSARARRYVDKFASRSSASSESDRNESSSNDSLDIREATFTNQPQDEGQLVLDNPDSPGSSSDDEQVFESASELEPEHPVSRNSRIRHHYSSSPTTPLSNDPSDGKGLVGGENPGDSKGLHVAPQQPIRELRSFRLSRHTQPPRIHSNDSISARAVINSEEGLEPRNHKPSISAIRETHALRIAGLHTVPRPYIRLTDRADIRRGLEKMQKGTGGRLSKADRDFLEESVLHVDFCPEEVDFICEVIMVLKRTKEPVDTDLRSRVVSLMVNHESDIPTICRVIESKARKPGKDLGRQLLRHRDTAGICAFLQDAAAGCVTVMPRLICIDSKPRPGISFPKPSISRLLRERETWGTAPFRVRQGWQPFNVEISSHIEDSLVRQSEWTDCCGDISAISWTGDNTFICGATAHSDYHNMQYNKPGNLVVGSTSLDTLRAVDGHRIIRPIVDREENAENSLQSMRQTQDPWLYTSVVSTSQSGDYTFTASFDETVKIWKVSEDGSSMNLCGTWKHDGKVNFVVTSENHGRIATASDVSSNAIRVYYFDEDNISDTLYVSYSGDKAQEKALELGTSDTWAYFPATIRWGRAPCVANLLLVGYSPRSITDHENDIPEDKKNSGELCIFNTENGQRVQISAARTQNVFEVIWHPTQPIFLAATSPCGTFEPEVKTQIRLFALNESGAFLDIKALDCPASDINELTIQPNSLIESYVTASCTDGNTYVWDTAQGDDPIHVLGHGDSLDNPLHDLPREVADTGVKFASWGRTTDRFYTGSSDGKVKAWDVRAPRGQAFVRTVLSVSGGVSAGAFSKDFSKLLIGDATGKVHLLAVDDSDLEDDVVSGTTSANTSAGSPAMGLEAGSAGSLPTRRPKVIIPHPEPLPPAAFEHGVRDEEQTGQTMARAYLEKGQLVLHPDRGIGVIQGPNYAQTLLYRYEAHEEGDGTRPLRPEWNARQQFHLHSQASHLQLPRLPSVESSSLGQHETNQALDLDLSRLSSSVREELERDGVDGDFSEQDHRFEFEMTPRYAIFKEKGDKHKYVN